VRDPIIAAVRRVRQKLDKQCGNNVERLADRLCVVQQEFSALVIDRSAQTRRGAAVTTRDARTAAKTRHDPAA
jgi:hypothetical protein